MNRNYTAKKYLEIINKLRAVYPLFSFTTDIIVGFPGETEKEFKQTCDFVKQASFTKVHIFPFSPRPDTPAAKMPNQVQDKIKTARAKKLATVANLVAKKYAKQFKGLTRPVLIEQKTTKDWWGGYTPEYLRAKIKSDNDLTNKIVEIKL
jgi:threonylcarbamoyladenosine tRNA methylthiotransferase MtaB